MTRLIPRVASQKIFPSPFCYPASRGEIIFFSSLLLLHELRKRKENDEDRKEYRMDREWELVISSLLANLCNGL